MDLNLPKMAYGIQKEEILWKEIKSKLSRMTIDKLLRRTIDFTILVNFENVTFV